jgi:hypothetical protein
MKLPDPVPVSLEALRAIGEQYGFVVDAYPEAPQTGIINSIYTIGNDLILRVPRNHPAHIEQTRRESLVAPIARTTTLLEILRFLLNSPPSPWQKLCPPRGHEG